MCKKESGGVSFLRFWEESYKKEENTAMREDYRIGAKGSIGAFEHLEEIVRHKIQEFIQELLEEEVEATLGRKRYE